MIRRRCLGIMLLSAVAAPHLAAQLITRTITVARLGYPTGIPLEGATAAAPIDFPLPPAVRVVAGTLALSLDITKAATPGSNIQFFVNGERRLVLPRVADGPSPVSVTIALAARDLRRTTLHVEVRSFLAIARDRCVDERLGSAYATILPESSLQYSVDSASVTSVHAAYGLFPDTVTLGVSAQAMTPASFALGYDLVSMLRADGHGVAFTAAGRPANLSLDSTATVSDIVSWRRLETHRGRALPETPTLDQLGVSRPAHLYGYRTSWSIPVDLRVFAPDRVPDGLDLQVLSAPSGFEKGVQFHVYMNGTLLRSFLLVEDGKPQMFHADIPQYLVATYNEIRVEAQRHRDPADYCQEAEALFPAQLLGTSTLTTRRATKTPHLFTGVGIRLTDSFPLFVPQEALTSPAKFLPALTALSRGVWGNRIPTFMFTSNATPSPSAGFVLVTTGFPRGVDGAVTDSAGTLRIAGPGVVPTTLESHDRNGLIVEAARLAGHHGIIASLGNETPLPDAPEYYSNNDVMILPAGGVALSVNTSGIGNDFLYDDFTWLKRYAWTTREIVGIAVLVLLIAALVWTAWRRDTSAKRRIREQAERDKAERDKAELEKVDTGATTT